MLTEAKVKPRATDLTVFLRDVPRTSAVSSALRSEGATPSVT
jgi:hypothetical protein